MRYSQKCDSKRIEAISLYLPKFSATKREGRKNVSGYHIVFALIYFYQAYWCISTSGDPYRNFLLKAEREGFQVMEGNTQMRAELEYAFQDVNDPDRPQDKIGWFDWMEMDIEEHAARKKKEKEQSVVDSLPKSMRVPKRYMPEFVPMLISGIVVTLHLLVLLMQHWSVAFRVWLNYREVNVASVEIPSDLFDLASREEELTSGGITNSSGQQRNPSTGNRKRKTLGEMVYERAYTESIPSHLPTHARIQPSSTSTSSSSNKHILVPLLYLPTLGLTFEYHRRRYVHDPKEQVWTKIRCQTKMPTTFFSTWSGLSHSDQLTASQIRFGKNEFNVRQPSFREMYKAQLLSPFTVFQLFCVVLWLLDDYWQYSFFTLFMILVFEATVVFSRIKCLGALKGMGNQSRHVWCFRMDRWDLVDSFDLLPGDLISLTRAIVKIGSGKGGNGSNTGPQEEKEKEKATVASTIISRESDEGRDIVPADLLLLQGSAVVNEASLTGESIPQIKEGMGADLVTATVVEDSDNNDFNGSGGEELNMKNQHKTHVLYAGTKMLQCKSVEVLEAEEFSSDDENNEKDKEQECKNLASSKLKPYASIPTPPDGGCLCFVLRTGFSSAQGKLVRMIEGSQEKVKGHERETGLLLLLLFFFAAASSSYVLHHGLKNENRSQYELLLHCILIITSVIPPELPMQMAMAVNNSLMTLMKMQVFCTEPYRVPIAGKLDACLFDKTGTLTTDELVAVGVCSPNALDNPFKGGNGLTASNTTSESSVELTPMTKVANHAALVLAGCHSLVLIDGEITGDPLENASLTAMRWGLDATTGHAIPLPSTEKKQEGKAISITSQNIIDIESLARHHFSSKLQRMSCVVRDTRNRRVYAVAKGSPEAIGRLLAKKPINYDKTSKALAKCGYRVISLGCKELLRHDDVEAAKIGRAACEENIEFAGFVAFTCRVRKDTKFVLGRILEGGMSVTMVTGDALLTAAHVAKEVGICSAINGGDRGGEDNSILLEKNEELREFLKKKKREKNKTINGSAKVSSKAVANKILILEKDDAGMMFWQSYDDDSRVQGYEAKKVRELSLSGYDLATTGKNLMSAFDFDEGTTRVLGYFKIFARMTPDAKETVIECLHSVGTLCLMCGDGANDVGALKQADVGVALLSGFGDVNVDKGEDGNKKKTVKDGNNLNISPATTIISKKKLDALKTMPVFVIKAKLRADLGVEANKYPDIIEKSDLVELYQIKAREKALKMHEKKNHKLTKVEMKTKARRDMDEKQKKLLLRTKELQEQGVKWAQVQAFREFYGAEASAAKKRNAKVGGVEGQAASLAAQFDDLELDEIPMVKLGDASIAAPFTSKMPSIRSCVDIIRQGRCTLVTSMQMYQILALNCLISSYSLSVLYLDGVKYGDVQMTAMGMLGSISYMSVSRSKPLPNLSPVKPLGSIFHPSMFLSLLGQFAVHLVVMMMAVRGAKGYLSDDHQVDLDGEFKPGILNSVVFLVSNVQQVTVFVVNLQGRPFMTGLTENRPLLWSLVATFILTFMFASESLPGLNKYFQLVPFPDQDFRDFILKLLVIDVVATFSFDRFMKFIFSPDILLASVKGTTVSDILGLGKTIGMILFVMYMFLGNDETWEMLLEEQELYETEIGIGESGAAMTTEVMNATEINEF